MRYLIGIDIGLSATKTVLFENDARRSRVVTGISTLSATEWLGVSKTRSIGIMRWRKTICDVVQESGVNPQDIKAHWPSGLARCTASSCSTRTMQSSVRPSSGVISVRARNARRSRSASAASAPHRDHGESGTDRFTASKIPLVRNHEAENYRRCRHILLPKDYIRFRMTGEYATEVSDASGMQLLDIPNRCWSDEILEKLEIDKALLPKAHESPEVTGTISKEFSEKTGLSVDTVVVGGAGDNAAAAVGTGIVFDGRAFTTIGTSGVVFAHTSEPRIDPQGRVHTFCCAVPGCWHVMGVTQAAGLSLKWCKDQLADRIPHESRERGLRCLSPDQSSNRRCAARQPPIDLSSLSNGRTHAASLILMRVAYCSASRLSIRADILRAVMEGASVTR